MTAPFIPPKASGDAFDAELASANRWRGECIQQFAMLEEIIAETLECLAAAKPSLKIKQGEQIRPSFDHLRRALGKKEVVPQCYGLDKSLTQIERLIGWRAHLTHGVLAVWRDKSGEWLLTFQHREPGGGPPRMHPVTRNEADRLLDKLVGEVKDLRSRAGQLRAGIQPKES